MARITRADMKVEHYSPRSSDPAGELNWKNLLAACVGGEGGPLHLQTCDTRKADRGLTVDPLSETVDRHLSYLVDGRIKSLDDRENVDIESHLNLNAERLKRNRQQALDSLVGMLKRRYGSDRWSKRQLEDELERLRTAVPLPSYMGVYEHWLRKWIARRPL
jgi:uncharacterized protein (TIGR02646 family)